MTQQHLNEVQDLFGKKSYSENDSSSVEIDIVNAMKSIYDEQNENDKKNQKQNEKKKKSDIVKSDNKRIETSTYKTYFCFIESSKRGYKKNFWIAHEGIRDLPSGNKHIFSLQRIGGKKTHIKECKNCKNYFSESVSSPHTCENLE